MVMPSLRLGLFVLGAVLVAMTTSAGFFYLELPGNRSEHPGDKWVRPALKQYSGLQQDFNLVSNRKLWIKERITPEDSETDSLDWTYLGTVVDAGVFALIWRGDLDQIVRMEVGDEIAAGVKVLDIDNNSMRYTQDGKEKVVLLFDASKPAPK